MPADQQTFGRREGHCAFCCCWSVAGFFELASDFPASDDADLSSIRRESNALISDKVSGSGFQSRCASEG